MPQMLRTHVNSNNPNSSKQLIDWFAPDITTDVGTEPLTTKNFPGIAKLIHEESYGRCSLILITHGVRKNARKMYASMEETIDLIHRGIIKNAIITMDFSRFRGNISYDTNKESYIDTLQGFRPVLSIPNRRLTVSLQGNQDRKSSEYLGKVYEMYKEIMAILGWSDEELDKLNENWRPSYNAAGRAINIISEEESIDCEVIPDPPLIYRIRKETKPIYRGRLDAFRRAVEAQPLRQGKTYGDTVNDSAWRTVLRL